MLVGPRRTLLTSGSSREARALFGAMTIKPPQGRKVLYDRTIKALKRSGWWDAIDVYSDFSAHDEQAALLNWKNPGASAGQIFTNSGTTFAADDGFTGDNATTFLDLGIALSALSFASLNDMTFLFWSGSDVNANERDFGTAGATVNTLVIGRTTGALQTRGNADNADTDTVSDSLGLYGFDRYAADTYDMVKNGAVEATKSRASSSLGTGNISVLRCGGTFSSRKARGVIIAKSGVLNGLSQAALYSAMRSYKLGVGVI